MSNNGIPPLNDWQADNYPVIYDEGADTLQYVKTGTKVDINTGGSSYLVYTALFTQTGTNAPVVTVLENTLGQSVVWSRSGVGDYRGTVSTPIFSEFKMYITPGGDTAAVLTIGLAQNVPFDNAVNVSYQSPTEIRVQVFKTSDFSYVEWSDISGGVLPLEARLYP